MGRIRLLMRRHRPDEMYIGHGRLCVSPSVFLSIAAFPHYCTDPDVTWWNAKGALWLCTFRRICNRCTGFVAMTTQLTVRDPSLSLTQFCAQPSSLCPTPSPVWSVSVDQTDRRGRRRRRRLERVARATEFDRGTHCLLYTSDAADE